MGSTAAAQTPSTWSYRGVLGKGESGALASAGTYAGGTLLDAACSYVGGTLDPTGNASGDYSCAAGSASATSFASSRPGEALRARASIETSGRLLESGLNGGLSSFASASQAVRITVGPTGAAPATLAFFVDLSGGFTIDRVAGQAGFGFGQGALRMGANTVPSYTGATFASVAFTTTSAGPLTVGAASFAGAADPAIAGGAGTRQVSGRAQFLMPSAVGENYFSLDLSAFAFVFNPTGGEASTSAFASVDFARSARIVGLQAFDAGGNDVTAEAQLTIVGESIPLGAPAVVPEPSTYALLGTGLVVLGGAAARRRRRA